MAEADRMAKNRAQATRRAGQSDRGGGDVIASDVVGMSRGGRGPRLKYFIKFGRSATSCTAPCFLTSLPLWVRLYGQFPPPSFVAGMEELARLWPQARHPIPTFAGLSGKWPRSRVFNIEQHWPRSPVVLCVT
jgi:hypothetical protein